MSEREPGEWRDPETGKVDRHELMYKVRAAFAVLVSLAVLVGGGWFILSKAQTAWYNYRTAEDYLGPGDAAVQVTIPKGSTVPQIAQILVTAGVIKSTKAFTSAAAASTSSIQAGKYNMLTQMTAKDALARLLDTNNLVHNRMTLKEGKRISDQAAVMSSATGIPAASFTAAYADWKNLGVPGWGKNGLEGFLYPDTYELPDKPTAKSVIQLATKQFKSVADDLDLVSKADKLGYSPYQVLIAASIIEMEVGNNTDRAKVARVIYNRLDQGMALGMDSTIAYALGKSSGMEFTDAQLAVKSPYNTRIHKGLPPGPISNPSKASIQAALNPTEGDWTYFVTVNPSTGETLFTSDSKEWANGVAEYKAWCAASSANHKVCYG
jgi:UPF0755 protein